MIKKTPDIQQIARLSLFSQLPGEQLEKIAHLSHVRSYESGEIVFFEGDESEHVLVVSKGQVLVHKNLDDGREQYLDRFGAGEILNLVPLLLHEKPCFNANGRAVTKAEVLFIPNILFENLMQENQSLNQILLKILAKRLDARTRLAASLSLKTVRARLAEFLIRQADQERRSQGYTQEEIAAEIGTVRDMVGRLLRDFEVNGWLQRERNQIRLIRREALEHEARREN